MQQRRLPAPWRSPAAATESARIRGSGAASEFYPGGQALGVTTSAVRVQIRTLEEYLVRPLFRRNGREVHLTPQGQASAAAIPGAAQRH